jgi:serine/threonine-protein kinase RsbW
VGPIETLVYERSLPAEPESVSTLRRGLTGALRPLDVGDERLADIALVVSEALTNAAMHAYVSMTPGTVTLVAAMSSGGLRVTVTDDGRGMVARTDSPGLGLGLSVMSRLADALEISSPGGRGTEVCLTFQLSES